MFEKEEYITQGITVGTTAVSLFSPDAGDQWYLTRIWIANNDTATRQYSLYFDNDGTTYTSATAIGPLVPLDAGRGEYIDLNIPMRVSSGNFGIKSSVSGMTFTLFGIKL